MTTEPVGGADALSSGRTHRSLGRYVLPATAVAVPAVVALVSVVTGLRHHGPRDDLRTRVPAVMLPTVVRSTEQMLRLVPHDLREASYALGIPKWRTIISVVLPTALSGIVTGVMLGVARVAGETAPLLLLVGINQRIELSPFAPPGQPRPQEALTTLIYDQFGVAAGNTASPPFQRAWGAALVLIVLIALLNLLARLITRFARVRR